MSAADGPTPGTNLGGGRFAIVGVLGEGAQATTYEAVDKLGGRLVAIKRFSVRGANSWKDVELAEREASVLSGLSHPLLPRYLAHFEEDGALFLAMEKVEGVTLAELREQGKLSFEDVCAFLNDAAETLQYLHGRAPPIIHRDIKPKNVIRRPDGRAVLVDFGSVAHVLRPEGGSTVVGTFGYMAPEQFQGRAMPGTDVYAVGATALSLLAGRDPDKLPHKGLAIDVEAALGPGSDPRLRRLLVEATNPDPDVRSAFTLHGLLEKHGLLRGRNAARAAGQAPRDGGAADRRSDAPSGSHAAPRTRSSRHSVRERSRRRWRSPPGRAAWLWLQLPPLLAVVLVGLWVARVANAMLMSFALPVLLTVLSWVFGPGPRRGALRCATAGRHAEEALRASGRWIRAFAHGPNPFHAEGTAPGAEARGAPARRWRIADEVIDAEGVSVGGADADVPEPREEARGGAAPPEPRGEP